MRPHATGRNWPGPAHQAGLLNRRSGGGRPRTSDLRITSHNSGTANQPYKGLPAESGKVPQKSANPAQQERRRSVTKLKVHTREQRTIEPHPYAGSGTCEARSDAFVILYSQAKVILMEMDRAGCDYLMGWRNGPHIQRLWVSRSLRATQAEARRRRRSRRSRNTGSDPNLGVFRSRNLPRKKERGINHRVNDDDQCCPSSFLRLRLAIRRVPVRITISAPPRNLHRFPTFCG